MTRLRLQTACSTAVVATLATICLVPRPLAHPRESQVTWTTDIASIVKTRCAGCHSPGGFAPMSLMSYEDARTWAKPIREAVLERRMPPWPAARGFGDFSNDRSLSPLEVELLAEWASGGTPLGPPVPLVTASRAAASTRAPDLVLTAASPQQVTASSARIELPTGLDGERWITGWEIRPGNHAIVERAVLSTVPGSVLGTWTPPEGAIVYPSGVASRLGVGARIVIELRYKKSAAAQSDQSGVALYFGRRPKRELKHQRFPCGAQSTDGDIEVLAVTPRASSAGASIEIIAARPDQTMEPLSVVRRYQPQYPITYRLRHPARLPRGSVVHVRSSSLGCEAGMEFVRR
jgi:hypothetical protein